jgi:hypothetical protein
MKGMNATLVDPLFTGRKSKKAPNSCFKVNIGIE